MLKPQRLLTDEQWEWMGPLDRPAKLLFKHAPGNAMVKSCLDEPILDREKASDWLLPRPAVTPGVRVYAGRAAQRQLPRRSAHDARARSGAPPGRGVLRLPDR